MAETMQHLNPAIMHDEALAARLQSVLSAMDDEMMKFGTLSCSAARTYSHPECRLVY